MVGLELIKSEILAETGEQIESLYRIWSGMFVPKTCEECLHKLKEHVHNFYRDLLHETEEKKFSILDKISVLQSEVDKLANQLNQDTDLGSKRPDKMPLVTWSCRLDESIARMQEQLRARRAEFDKLLLEQKQLCRDLGELPLTLPDSEVLPTPEDTNKLREHIRRLQSLKSQRLVDLNELRQEIKKDMQQLDLTPRTQEEEQLLNPNNPQLCADTLDRLSQMRQSCLRQLEELGKSIDDKRQKLEQLWQRLPEARIDLNRQEYTKLAHDQLQEELQRGQNLLRLHLKDFTEKVRLEIRGYWNLTLKSQPERLAFSHINNNSYTEELLELHELELNELKAFYQQNKDIFQLFASRTELWTRLMALEAKANAPNRFNNRGGHLLREEKERKAISTKLPKIELQITALVQAYELRSNSVFLVRGENIMQVMANDWKSQHQVRKPTPATGTVRKSMPATPVTPRSNNRKSTEDQTQKRTYFDATKTQASSSAKRSLMTSSIHAISAKSSPVRKVCN